MTKTTKNVKNAKNVKNEEIVSNVETIQTNHAIATIDEIVSNEQTIVNNEIMSNEYELFLKSNNYEYSIIEQNDEIVKFEIFGLKKRLFIAIDNNLNISNVATILNNREMIRANCRNILTLKSLKATKSYTNAQIK